VLTDILGSEDALGDMDFKVAGDGEGISAFQMDIKVGSAAILSYLEPCILTPKPQTSNSLLSTLS